MSIINVRPGDPITAELLNDIANRRSSAGIRATGGIDARQTSDGSIQLSGKFTGAFFAITGSSGISARSGSTPGTGIVDVQIKNPSTGNYEDSGLSMTVDSVSSFTGGIPSGCWCTCFFQDDGTPSLLNVDYGA